MHLRQRQQLLGLMAFLTAVLAYYWWGNSSAGCTPDPPPHPVPQGKMWVIKSCMSALLPWRYSECWGSAGAKPLAHTGHNRRLQLGLWKHLQEHSGERDLVGQGEVIAHQCAGAIRHVSILNRFYDMGCHVLVRSCILGSFYRGFSGWHLFHSELVLPLYIHGRCWATSQILLRQGWLPSV